MKIIIKILFAIFLLLHYFNIAHSQITFQKYFYVGGGWDESYSVQQTIDEGYIIAGRDSGGMPGNVYLIKTDTNGNMLWSKDYGGSVGEVAYSLQQTVDEGYIICGRTGSFGSGVGGVYIIKTDSIGDTLWTRVYGSIWTPDEGRSVKNTNDGGYIVGGFTNIGLGTYDIFLIKLNANGNMLWSKIYQEGTNDVAYSILQTSDGGYILAGHTQSFGAGQWDVYLIKTDSIGNMLWTKTYGGITMEYGYSVQETTDNGFIIVGFTNSFGAGSKDIYLIKTDSQGDTLWTKTYGGNSYDIAHSVYKTYDKGYIIAGYTNSFGFGGEDVYLIKTDSIGNLQWAKIYGDTFDNRGYSVQQTVDSGYIISGYTRKPGKGYVYLIKTDVNGNSGCSQQMDVTANTIVANTSTIVGPGGTVSVTGGEFNSTTTIITNTLTTDSLFCLICNLSLVITTNNISCNGDSSGSINLTISGGTVPYTYSWSNGDTTEDITGLTTGVYKITISDSIGCILTDSITISEPDSITITSIVVTATQGNNDGAINITVSGGNPPYTFSWDNGATSEDLDNIAAGTYTVTVTDSLGCVDSVNIVVSEITGIKQSLLINAELKIYPNPNDGTFLLKYSIPDKQSAEFIILDVMGRKLKIYQLESGMKERNIANKALKNGMYFYQVIVNNRVILTDKLVIIK